MNDYLCINGYNFVIIICIIEMLYFSENSNMIIKRLDSKEMSNNASNM